MGTSFEEQKGLWGKRFYQVRYTPFNILVWVHNTITIVLEIGIPSTLSTITKVIDYRVKKVSKGRRIRCKHGYYCNQRRAT